MKYGTNCKFCKKPITIEIDDAYAELGDPYKLLPMAACNRCADLRVQKRNIEGQLGSLCASISVAKGSKDGMPKNAKSNVERLTKIYASLIARWNNLDGMAWEPGIVDAIIADPHHWGDISHRMWQMCRKPNNT